MSNSIYLWDNFSRGISGLGIIPKRIAAIRALSWDDTADTYDATSAGALANIHGRMRRCVLNSTGVLQYYLKDEDSTKKADGTAANIDGTDGNVMVEIPKFYFRQVRNGNTLEWQISDVPLAGYQLHPAFFKDGEIVDFRYMGAYDACVYDDSASAYIAGLNLDDNTGNIDTANDKLASVSGVYPMVGVTRDECRSLAANNGIGWRQQDFWLTCAVQMLYLIEYGDFHSQSYLGAGNTNGSYLASSADQNDSPHTIAGASNSLGNASTNTTTGAGVSAKPGTSFMSYRGIENFFGNVFNWVDGFNILADHQAFVTNNRADFADNTSTGFQFLGTLHNSNGFVTNILDVPGAFLPSAVGGSSSTFLADKYFQNTGNRVAFFGGRAAYGALAGAFVWNVDVSSSAASRNVGARLSF